eukprot:1162043-Pelagomonas_calceolata.AAC.2
MCLSSTTLLLPAVHSCLSARSKAKRACRAARIWSSKEASSGCAAAAAAADYLAPLPADHAAAAAAGTVAPPAVAAAVHDPLHSVVGLAVAHTRLHPWARAHWDTQVPAAPAVQPPLPLHDPPPLAPTAACELPPPAASAVVAAVVASAAAAAALPAAACVAPVPAAAPCAHASMHPLRQQTPTWAARAQLPRCL